MATATFQWIAIGDERHGVITCEHGRTESWYSPGKSFPGTEGVKARDMISQHHDTYKCRCADEWQSRYMPGGDLWDKE